MRMRAIRRTLRMEDQGSKVRSVRGGYHAVALEAFELVLVLGFRRRLSE